MASLLAYILFSCAAAFTPLEPLTDSPSYVIDPLTHTHGVMVSPERIIIKLDCPLCPIYNRTWNSKATALVSIGKSLVPAVNSVDPSCPRYTTFK